MYSLFTRSRNRTLDALTLFKPFAGPAVCRAIQEFAHSLKGCCDAELRHRSLDLRDQSAGTAAVLDRAVLIPAIGLMIESIRRQMGHEIYDVQIDAALALARGSIVEMQTGEGKTLAASLTAYLHALPGRGVHVVTSNAYLAGRDQSELSPVFERLGLTCGFISDRLEPGQKRLAYECDITYGPGYEFGFDYLRDQVQLRGQKQQALGQRCLSAVAGDVSISSQRALWLAIVDEADNVLLDDACSPLILSESSPAEAPDSEIHRKARDLAFEMKSGEHFVVDPATGRITFTPSGGDLVARLQDEIPVRHLQRPWNDYVEQAARARWFFCRDVDYIVDDEVRIVDSTTGRVFEDRKWSDGLHQAIEAKEGLKITAETRSLARVTRQRFYGLYRNLAGLTGTATGGEGEFKEIYQVGVVPVPVRIPSKRTIQRPRFFVDANAKAESIVGEIADCHRHGRPVLVGTRTIQESDDLSCRLAGKKIPHRVLNGRQCAEESEIVAAAGQLGAVTISTNLAGRGTDIKLSPASRSIGGLHVIVSGRHESSRIDRQLIGRSARQGDPGSARIFCSADDWLAMAHAPWIAQSLQRHADRAGETRIDFSTAFNAAQRSAEQRLTQIRRQMYLQDQQRNQAMTRIEGHSESQPGPRLTVV